MACVAELAAVHFAYVSMAAVELAVLVIWLLYFYSHCSQPPLTLGSQRFAMTLVTLVSSQVNYWSTVLIGVSVWLPVGVGDIILSHQWVFFRHRD